MAADTTTFRFWRPEHPSPYLALAVAILVALFVTACNGYCMFTVLSALFVVRAPGQLLGLCIAVASWRYLLAAVGDLVEHSDRAGEFLAMIFAPRQKRR